MLATDGLFDNMPESAVLSVRADGLEPSLTDPTPNCGPSATPYDAAGPSPPRIWQVFDEHGGAAEEELARMLATRALELSLDSSVDSPFAILAKENDILWGGGRPDDITVIVSTIVDISTSAPPAAFTAFAGPGPPPSWASKPDPPKEEKPNFREVGFEEWH